MRRQTSEYPRPHGLIFILALLLCLAVPSSSADAVERTEPPATKTREGGRLHKIGKVHVAVLQGNYRQMGRQYGLLLGEAMRRMWLKVPGRTEWTRIDLNRFFSSDVDQIHAP